MIIKNNSLEIIKEKIYLKKVLKKNSLNHIKLQKNRGINIYQIIIKLSQLIN